MFLSLTTDEEEDLTICQQRFVGNALSYLLVQTLSKYISTNFPALLQ